MVVHTSHSSTLEVEVGRSKAQGHSQLQSEFESSSRYIISCLQKGKEEESLSKAGEMGVLERWLNG